MHRIRRNLHDRPLIRLPRPENIIENRKQNHRAGHQNRKIHMYGCHGSCDGPEAEEEYYAAEEDGECVDYDAEDPGKVERAPDELVRLSCIV